MVTKTDQQTLKQAAGEAAASAVKDGHVVGLGTGSTVEWTIKALGRKVAEGLEIIGIPTSERSAKLARDLKIPLTTLEEHPVLDVTIDGADEVDRDFDLVKGGGGALTREKIVAAASKYEIIVVDPSKMVDLLARSFPLPVEVVPMAVPTVRAELETMGCEVQRRLTTAGKPFKTDNSMAILDARFPEGVKDKKATEAEIGLLPGVLENGLFLGLCHEVIVGHPDGVKRLEPGQWL